MGTLSLVTGPTTWPLSVADCKQHLRIDHSDEDTLIEGYLRAATAQAETVLDRQIMPATWRLSFHGFCGWQIDIPKPPLQSVSSITYLDTAGTTQTLSSSLYIVDTYSEPGRITPAYNAVWPSVRWQMNSVIITFVAGYTSALVVPDRIKTGIKFLVSQWYEHRELTTGGIEMSSEVERAFRALIIGDAVLGYF